MQLKRRPELFRDTRSPGEKWWTHQQTAEQTQPAWNFRDDGRPPLHARRACRV